MEYGRFDDAKRCYTVTNPLPPKAWINYLGNGRLQAFISQNAGGLLWFLEPEDRRVSRYQYIASPQDRPGFYLYVRDRKAGTVWNPHFAPRCQQLDSFACHHAPGITQFEAAKDSIALSVEYLIPQADDVLVWKIRVTNNGKLPADLQLANYIEFGILELAREAWFCYLQRCTKAYFNKPSQCVRYDYFPYEAAYAPRMVVGCSQAVAGFDCSREAFIGRGGSLETPHTLLGAGLGNSELPTGGHTCAVLGTDVTLAPGESRNLSFVYAMADEWEPAEALVRKYSDMAVVQSAADAVRASWAKNLDVMQANTGDAMADRFINTWNGYQALVSAGLPAPVSIDHMGVGGMLYRDMTQAALAAANMDPPLALDRLEKVFASQKADGMGCHQFSPYGNRKPTYGVRRSDNTVWQIYTLHNLVSETGDISMLDRQVPFVDGGSGSLYDHTLRGLAHIYEHRGPTGLPLMFYADWNDCLVYWQSEITESVMLGMQLQYSCKLLGELATRLGKSADAQWCTKVAAEMDAAVNSDRVWDGRWYRRLIIGDKHLGGQDSDEGQIWINPQTWSVLCGAGDFQGRGAIAMDEVANRLDSPIGLVKQDPVPGLNPATRKPGQNPGVGENGGIFCHTNTWAIMAEAMLGRHDRAFNYYKRILPAVVAQRFGQDHYLREPYVFASSIVGPVNPLFGQGGISWLTGTAPWMYVAATQYVLGVKPTLDGLSVTPCLPATMTKVHVTRHFRGATYEIDIDNAVRGKVELEVDGQKIDGTVIKPGKSGTINVRCKC